MALQPSLFGNFTAGINFFSTGMWFTILLFLNFIGIFTNAFIIGFTSRFGRKYQTTVVQYNVTGMVQNCSLINQKSNEGFVNIRLNAHENLWIIVIFEVRGFFFVVENHSIRYLKNKRQTWSRVIVKLNDVWNGGTIFAKVANWWQKAPLKTDSSIRYVSLL